MRGKGCPPAGCSVAAAAAASPPPPLCCALSSAPHSCTLALLFSAELVSPVSMLSSTLRSLASSRRRSAGTRSPRESSTMSPGTSSEASISTGWPSRMTLHREGSWQEVCGVLRELCRGRGGQEQRAGPTWDRPSSHPLTWGAPAWTGQPGSGLTCTPAQRPLSPQ